jgi:hypothetical protein
MQTALASGTQPAVFLWEKTPFLFETMLRDLPTDLRERQAFHSHFPPFRKYSNSKP